MSDPFVEAMAIENASWEPAMTYTRTSAVTADLLALADMLENEPWHNISPDVRPSIIAALRSRAQSAPTDAMIEECARVVEHWSLPTIQTPSMWLVDKAGIAAEIRSLKDAALPSTPSAPEPFNQTSRDWDVCNAVDAYRAPRNEGDERTLSDFLEEKGLRVCAVTSTVQNDVENIEGGGA